MSSLPFEVFLNSAAEELTNVLSQFENPLFFFPKRLSSFVALFINRIPVEKQPKRYFIESIKESTGHNNVVCLTTNDKSYIDQLSSSLKKAPKYIKTILVIPKITAYLRQSFIDAEFTVIDHKPTSGKDVCIREYLCDFLPISNDFLLMPSVNVLSQLLFDHDYTELVSVARSLSKIQIVFGQIPHVVTFGKYSHKTYNLLKGIMDHCNMPSSIAHIDSLILIDRTTDLVTPLLTICPVEGLIDNSLGIDYGRIEFPENFVPDSKIVDSRLLTLKNNDPIFQHYRHNHMSTASSWIKNKTTEIEGDCGNLLEALDEVKQRGNMRELSSLATNTKDNEKLHNYMQLHIQLIEYVSSQFTNIYGFRPIISQEGSLLKGDNNYPDLIDNLIFSKNDWLNAMGLLFLQKLTNLRVRKDYIKNIFSEIQLEYGLEQAAKSFINIDNFFKFSNDEKVFEWDAIKKSLNLVDEKTTDPLYSSYDQYIPLSIKLIQKVVDNDLSTKWTKNFNQKINQIHTYGNPPKKGENEPRKVLVFFIGGVTLGETSLLRHMGESHYKGNVEFIVGSTDKINRKSLITQFCPFLQ